MCLLAVNLMTTADLRLSHMCLLGECPITPTTLRRTWKIGKAPNYHFSRLLNNLSNILSVDFLDFLQPPLRTAGLTKTVLILANRLPSLSVLHSLSPVAALL